MRKKNTVIMSVSLLVAALFIGTAITPVIASLSGSISNVERVDAEAETDSATESEEIIDSAEQAEAIAEVAEEIAAEIVAEELEASSIAEQAEAIAEVAEEGCSQCGDASPSSGELATTVEGGCDTCTEAVDFAIDHMLVDMEEYLEDMQEDGWYFLAAADFILNATGSLIYWFAQSGYELEIDVEELTANVQYWVELLVGPQQHLITLFVAALVAIGAGIATYLVILCMGADSVPGSASSAQSTSQETAQSSEVTAATATIPINTIMRSTAYGSMGL